MLAKVVSEARKRGIKRLLGLYIPSPKNSMVASHYEKLGFHLRNRDARDRSEWELAVADYAPPALPMIGEDHYPADSNGSSELPVMESAEDARAG